MNFIGNFQYGYIVQEPAPAENGEVTMEVDSEQFGLADRVDSLSVHDEERLELQSEVCRTIFKASKIHIDPKVKKLHTIHVWNEN